MAASATNPARLGQASSADAADLFAARRSRLRARIGPASAALVASRPERVRNGTSNYRYRQHSDVYYLTGFDEPQAVVFLGPPQPTADATAGGDPGFVMFLRPSDPEQEVWEGRRLGLDGARARLGAGAVFPIAALEDQLPALVANCHELHYGLGVDAALDAIVLATLAKLRKTERRGQRPPRAIVDPLAGVHELRLFKDADELARLRRAAAITTEAHLAAMRAGRPGVRESELEALLEYTFRRRGGDGPGYPSIVGAGANATVLHYTENASVLRDGDLVLIDAGCEFGRYTADVTRTFPANGRFSAAQRALYDVVLATQRSAIERVAPGVTIEDLHQHCVQQLTEGMIRIGLLEGGVEERIADGSYRTYFMHGTSHWLGLDVHDAGAYTKDGEPRPLEPGMVITIEPGLYVADADPHPAEFRGLGVRIEDDILVTEAGHENLTAACPKDPDELANLCRS